MHATESYNLLRRGENKGDWTKDWRELQQDFADYSYVCRSADESIDNKRLVQVVKKFAGKKEKFLSENEMKDPDEGRDMDYFEHRMSAGQKEYQNKYWRIYFMNVQEWKENYLQHALSDYYEEMP